VNLSGIRRRTTSVRIRLLVVLASVLPLLLVACGKGKY
jgi:hypothetical protein